LRAKPHCRLLLLSLLPREEVRIWDPHIGVESQNAVNVKPHTGTFRAWAVRKLRPSLLTNTGLGIAT
jgi:hypothetical protein